MRKRQRKKNSKKNALPVDRATLLMNVVRESFKLVALNFSELYWNSYIEQMKAMGQIIDGWYDPKTDKLHIQPAVAAYLVSVKGEVCL